jgi:hypothetical protein
MKSNENNFYISTVMGYFPPYDLTQVLTHTVHNLLSFEYMISLS